MRLRLGRSLLVAWSSVLGLLVVCIPVQAATSTKPLFAGDLIYGSTSPLVIDLQRFLNNNGFPVASSGPGSPGKETDRFGQATRQALAAWQKTVPSLGLGGGVFGSTTLAYLNAEAVTDPQEFTTSTLAGAGRVPSIDPLADGYQMKANEFASAIVLDPASGKVLYQDQPDKVWTIASLSKLMTAMVVLDRDIKWNKVVTMRGSDEVGGARLRLAVGTKVTVKDLFYSSLVGSANNATIAMARQTGLSNADFVALMNKKAKALGLTHTVLDRKSVV